MLDDPNPAFDAETIRRMAREHVRITLTASEVDALRPLLDSLLEEIRRITTSDRAGAEPEGRITVEEWPK
jgi:hypothetical protein